MPSMLKILTLALLGAFASATFDSPAEAREPGAKKRQVRQAAPRHRVAQRPYAPPLAAPADPRMPYGGPGRAQFEPLVVGPQPERADGRNPEGP